MDNDVNIHYDEKGKFFTDKRIKEKIPAIIQTTNQKISGYIKAPPSSDILTELNIQEDQFIFIFDAVIQDKNGQSEYEIDTLTLNRNHIIWVINNSNEKTE